MKIDESAGDDAVAVELGRRLTGIRLAQNLSQRQLADAAGLGLRTIQRLEQGAVATQLSGFLRVCRVLGLLARIDRIFEEPPPSPTQPPIAHSNTRPSADRASSLGRPPNSRATSACPAVSMPS